MNILFLDDDRLRHRLFRASHPDAWFVETAAAAIVELDRRAFDILYLDHDLGGGVFCDSRDSNTGMAVVRWIEQNKPVIGRIVVHSFNAPAADRMVKALAAAGYNVAYRPFGLTML